MSNPAKGLAAFQHMDIAEATITNVKEPSQVVKCQFRPHEFSFVKKNNWEQPKTNRKSPKKAFQPPNFSGSSPFTLTMDLLFDTNEVKGNPDVRQFTQILWNMMLPEKGKENSITGNSDPPHVVFRWGTFYSFEAVITDMTQQFTLFKSDGTPVRAHVKITFLQAALDMQIKPQNPTSGGVQDYKVHIVKDGETIDWIAFERYGDPEAWRALATANNLDDPSRLQAGQRLLLVPIE